MRFEPLTEQHEVEGFSCGEASLDRWLAHHALTNQQRSLSRTFVAVDDLAGHPAGAGPVAGYVTLVAAAVEVAQLPGRERRGLAGLTRSAPRSSRVLPVTCDTPSGALERGCCSKPFTASSTPTSTWPSAP